MEHGSIWSLFQHCLIDNNSFFVTASGSKEKPIVIWRSTTPRYLQRFDKSLLPVTTYFNQKNAWMTGDILEEILSKLNCRLSVANRSILLLMDNAGCHPLELVSKYSQINICFLPANTTAKLQPLELFKILKFIIVAIC